VEPDAPVTEAEGTPIKRRYVWFVVLALIVAMFPFGVGALWYVGSIVLSSDLDPSPSVVLPFAGFEKIDGLLVFSSHHDGRLDEGVDFVLIGNPEDVDRALIQAEFMQAFSPGIHVQTPSTFDPSTMSNPQSALDAWRSPSGKTIHRRIVRGTSVEDPSKELVVVFAFTT